MPAKFKVGDKSHGIRDLGLLAAFGVLGAVGCSSPTDAGAPTSLAGASGALSSVAGGGSAGMLGGGSAAGGVNAAGASAGGVSAGGVSAGNAGMGGAGATAAGGSSGGSSGMNAAGGAAFGGDGSVSGGSGGAFAGAGGALAAAGAGGMQTNDAYLKTPANDYGFVNFTASSKNRILSFSTTLTVPAKPSQKTGTLFLWPGLQPGGANYNPINNGVLQPVLTWGGTCAPNAPKNGYASWWISGQYVNTYGSAPGYTGCLGGDGMNVQVGDPLQFVMTLSGTVWRQVVTDTVSNARVSYDLDLLGQGQNYAEFVIEEYTESPTTDVVFTASTMVFEKAEPQACQPTVRGVNDFFTNPKASTDGKQCSIDRLVLRAQGVPATTAN
ncbi:MAG: hypothetical protein ABI488_18440 [Polyangiaceae bacterium]